MNEAKQSLNDYLSKPLVDQKTASDLKSNCESLLKVGVKPDIDVLRYIKLAQYERGFTTAVRQFCKEKVRAEPTYKVEPKETRLDLINEIAIRMGESQGCWISCLECEGINCSVGSVIKEVYEIIKDGEEDAVDR